MRENALPIVGARLLVSIGRRTRLQRFAFAAVIVALVLAAAAAARNPDVRRTPFVPHDTDAIVVLDLSASISSDTYERIGTTLDAVARSNGRVALVVFSDVAYEALPPGTPAAALAPLVRYFELPKQERPGFLPEFPKNPWADTFSAGTRISTGLELARDVAFRERLRKPAVVLVSDLDDDPSDLARLRNVLSELQQERIRLRVVSLNASPEDERFFRRAVAGPQDVVQATLPGERAATARRAVFPVALAVAVLLALALVAANELLHPRLEWGGRA